MFVYASLSLKVCTLPIPCPVPGVGCCAMPGTDLTYGAICLRGCYAMPGTGLAYGAMRCPVLA
eukprot:443221-Rhodomonas_salina.4